MNKKIKNLKKQNPTSHIPPHKSKKNGITLIALIITIVIMLILATVTIGVINGGLFDYAGKAVSEVELASIIEDLKTKGIMKGKNNLNGTLSEVLGDDYSKYDTTFKVVNGELIYTGEDPKIVGYLFELGQGEGSIEVASLICAVKGHNFKPANYLNPKTCTRCGETEGSVLVATSPHPDQTAENTDIGIGTDGQLVNLDKWTYKLFQWTYTLTGYTGDYTEDGALEEGVTVPQKIKGIDVTAMEKTFKNNTNLKIAPEIPTTIKALNDTFSGCTALTEVPLIPYGVTAVNSAFRGCTSLEKLPEGFCLPDSITGRNIMSTFAGCTNLKELPDSFTISKNTTSIFNIFADCTSLEKLPEGFTIPDNVIELGYAFQNCKALTKLPDSFKLPTKANNTCNCMFSGCSNLEALPEEFTIPEGTTNIDAMFYGCSSLENLPENLSIPSTVKSLYQTFQGCSKLTKLPDNFNIPEGVTNLEYAFYGCKNLATLPENFSIPVSATNINLFFRSCPKLEGTLTILGNPSNVGLCFEYSSTSGNGLTVYYTDACTNIDAIRATVSSGAKITFEEITSTDTTE